MLLPPPEPVCSRHRLPRVFRVALALLWGAPALLLLLALAGAHGVAALDVRLLLSLAALTLPAVWVWREGVDVMRWGLVVRHQGWRRVPFAALERHALHEHPQGCVLTVWAHPNRVVLSVHAAHLTRLGQLLRALDARRATPPNDA